MIIERFFDTLNATVKPEIFATDANFRENKILAKWRIHCRLLMQVVVNVSFNALRKNKISRKFSVFTDKLS